MWETVCIFDGSYIQLPPVYTKAEGTILLSTIPQHWPMNWLITKWLLFPSFPSNVSSSLCTDGAVSFDTFFLNGVSFISLMLCFTRDVFPSSRSSKAKRSWYCVRRSLISCLSLYVHPHAPDKSSFPMSLSNLSGVG